MVESGEGAFLEAGTPVFRRARVSLFVAGFATFATLYCVQPLMPEFARAFAVSPAQSALALSLPTGFLAFSMLVAGAVSDRFGRKPVMVASLLASGVLGVLGALTPDWSWLLAVRALEGVALSGLPAVAMAYIGEEVEPRSVGLAMGLYIGGTALGGMSGRVLTAVVADLANWRVAMAVIGLLGLVAAGWLWAGLPASKHFVRRSAGLRDLGRAWRGHLADPGLRGLFAMGFLLMGAFVTVYNYAGFRLAAPPFDLRPALVGAIFLVYVAGAVGSPWFGVRAARHGSGPVLLAAVLLTLAGLALMLPDSLVAVIAGLTLFTMAFFGAHTIASGWIGQRARMARAQASAIYLFCYYMGSTIVGYVGGLFWTELGWGGVAGLVGLLMMVAVLIALRLHRLHRAGILPGDHKETDA
ncbi:MFS transporter [Azospirillum sp. sgz301742]